MGTGFRSVSFVIPETPYPAPRPKLTRHGVAYFPKRYSIWRADAFRHVPALNPPISVPVAVAVDHVLPPYKTVDTPWPKGDIDNYAKSVFDVITKAGTLWEDDIQVTFTIERKRFTAEGEVPHTYVYIREV